MVMQADWVNSTDMFIDNFTDFSLNDTTTKTGQKMATTTLSSELNFDIVKLMPEYLAAFWLDSIYLYILTVVGIVGNSLSICTILRMPPISSSSLYVVFLAIMDSLCLAIKLIYHQVTKYDVGIGDAGCRSLLFLGNASIMTANWLVVAMTTERMFAVWFPLKVSQISTKRTTCIVYVCLLVFFFSLNNIYLYMFKEVSDDFQNYYCGVHPEYQSYVENIFYWVDACFYALVPCACLIILNGSIIVATTLAMSSQRKMTQDKEKIDEKRKQQNQITVMLVTVSIIFMFLTIPNAMYFLNTSSWVVTTNKGYAVKTLVGRIVLVLSDLNHAVNFFLYFFSGRRFRQMFLKMIRCRSGQRGKRTYETTLKSYVSGTAATSVSTVGRDIELENK